MTINIKATNLDLTPPLREYIEERIGGLEKFLVKLKEKGYTDIRASVEVARSTRHHHKGQVYYAECNLYLPGRILRASENNFDIRAAIDVVKDKLKEEINKYKERRAI